MLARTQIGALQPAPGLPRTRSGKAVRRILRKVAEGGTRQGGDANTLADPTVVEDLIRSAPQRRPEGMHSAS